MPVVNIKRLGEVEYTRTTLPPGIKGKTKIGKLDFPLLISEDLTPGAKLDHVVAHEAGHRLTIELAVLTLADNPGILDHSNGAASALTHYYINHGLKETDMAVLHPEVRSKLHEIFRDNLAGSYTSEALAREFIAEVFADWATGTGSTPYLLQSQFAELIAAKADGELPALVSHDIGVPAADAAMPQWYVPQ